MARVTIFRQSITDRPTDEDTYDVYIQEGNVVILIGSFDNHNDGMSYFNRMVDLVEEGQSTLEEDVDCNQES